MKNITLFIYLVFISSITSSQTIWGKSFGGPSFDQPIGIVTDSDGNLITTGVFMQSIDVDPSEDSYTLVSSNGLSTFIQKLNSQGEIVWGVSIESNIAVESKSIACDSDNNIYILGQFNGEVDFNPSAGTTIIESNGASDIFLLKLNALGQYQWVKTYGSTLYDNPGDVFINDDDEIIVAGTFQLIVDLNPGTEVEEYTSLGEGDLFVQKLNSSGELQWNSVIHSDENIKCFHIESTSVGGVYVTGDFGGEIDFDPSSNEELITAQENSSTFLLSLTNTGLYNWVNVYEATFLIGIIDLSVTNDDDLFILLNINGVTDLDPGLNEIPFTSSGNAIAVQKISVNGNLSWSKEIESDGTGGIVGSTIINDSDASLVIAGKFTGSVDFDPDNEYLIEASLAEIYLLSLTTNGEFVFVHNFENSNSSSIREAVFSSTNAFYMYGSYADSMNVDIGSGVDYIYSTNQEADLYIINVGYVLGIFDIENNQNISIYPNPFTDGFYIDNTLLRAQTMTIYNANGSLIEQHQLIPNLNYFDLLHLKVGVYLIEIMSNKKSIVEKAFKIK
jgi:hypothetical protein